VTKEEGLLRPVLMTSAATVFGHLPLVFVSGPGAAARDSIGTVLVAGMHVGTLFTLFIVPVYLAMGPAMARRGGRLRRHRDRLGRSWSEEASMSLDLLTLVAILAMAAITYLTRIAGIFVAGRLALRGRAEAAFEAIPPAVLVAVIAPMALATVWRETVAALLTAIAATRLPLLATIATGVLAVVALRVLA
jgi:uncharacterized membrane protein